MPRWAAAIAAGDVRSTTRRTAATTSGFVSNVRGGEQLRAHHLGDAAAAPLGDVLGHFQPAGAGFVGVGGGPRVALHECPQRLAYLRTNCQAM